MGAHGSKRFKADLESLRLNDPTLTVLSYEETGLGDDGARVLAEALRGNKTLKRLRLGRCGLSALGLQRICRALCDTSVTPCHLRRLDLVSKHQLVDECSRMNRSPTHSVYRPVIGECCGRQWSQVSRCCESLYPPISVCSSNGYDV